MLGYPLRLTERDSWSGPEAGGFYIFATEKERADYVREQTKDRYGATPDWYMSYDNEPAIELSAASQVKLEDKRYFHVDQLFVKKQLV